MLETVFEFGAVGGTGDGKRGDIRLDLAGMTGNSVQEKEGTEE
jgi:hypothetical protein